MIGRVVFIWVGGSFALGALWALACAVAEMVNRWRWRRATRDIVREATDLAWEAEARQNPLLKLLYDDEDHP